MAVISAIPSAMSHPEHIIKRPNVRMTEVMSADETNDAKKYDNMMLPRFIGVARMSMSIFLTLSFTMVRIVLSETVMTAVPITPERSSPPVRASETLAGGDSKIKPDASFITSINISFRKSAYRMNMSTGVSIEYITDVLSLKYRLMFLFVNPANAVMFTAPFR